MVKEDYYEALKNMEIQINENSIFLQPKNEYQKREIEKIIEALKVLFPRDKELSGITKTYLDALGIKYDEK